MLYKSIFNYIREKKTHMLLKPAVLKGSLATGFGVGAGPGVPGDPETSRLYDTPIVE